MASMRAFKIIPDISGNLSKKGQDTLLTILSAARDVFIESGYGAFSLKAVAEKTGLARGNVTYYFANRDELLAALLRAIINGYMWDFDHIVAADGPNEEKLAKIIRLVIEDLGTKETSDFFPELWALANHNEIAAQEMKRLYDDARRHIVGLVKRINTKLSNDDAEALGLFISASMEGQTPFIGKNRPFNDRLPQIRNIAVYGFVELVKNIEAKDIRKLSKTKTRPGLNVFGTAAK